MQSVSSRIWTRVAVFISYDDNNYTTGTSISHMLFATFHNEHGTFFYAKFHSYVLTVYSNGMYESFQFFFIFCK